MGRARQAAGWRQRRPWELGAAAETAELVEAVDPLEVGEERGQLVLTKRIRQGLDHRHTRRLEDVNDARRDVVRDQLTATRAGKAETGAGRVELEAEVTGGEHDVAATWARRPNDGVAHA